LSVRSGHRHGRGNAVGAYGFLAKAHIGHAVASETAVAGRAADIEARITVQTGVVADLDRRLSQTADATIWWRTATGQTRQEAALRERPIAML